MINYKKPVFLITLFLIIILNNSAFAKKTPTSDFIKIEKNIKQCDVVIIDTIINQQVFKVCFNALKNKIEVNYKGFYVDFTPMESFNVKSTINNDVVLLTKKDKSIYVHSKLAVIDDNKIVLPLIDEFLSFGLYFIDEIDGKLEVSNINLDEKNTSYTELAYFDSTNKTIIIADKLSITGENNAVSVYVLSEKKPRLIKQKIIKWAKFKKQIKNSKDEYIYYKIIDKVITN